MVTPQDIAKALKTDNPKLYVADMARITHETVHAIRAQLARGTYHPPPYNSGRRRKQGERFFWRAVDVYDELYGRRGGK